MYTYLYYNQWNKKTAAAKQLPTRYEEGEVKEKIPSSSYNTVRIAYSRRNFYLLYCNTRWKILCISERYNGHSSDGTPCGELCSAARRGAGGVAFFLDINALFRWRLRSIFYRLRLSVFTLLFFFLSFFLSLFSRFACAPDIGLCTAERRKRKNSLSFGSTL